MPITGSNEGYFRVVFNVALVQEPIPEGSKVLRITETPVVEVFCPRLIYPQAIDTLLDPQSSLLEDLQEILPSLMDYLPGSFLPKEGWYEAFGKIKARYFQDAFDAADCGTEVTLENVEIDSLNRYGRCIFDDNPYKSSTLIYTSDTPVDSIPQPNISYPLLQVISWAEQNLNSWLSAAADDPAACLEFKSVITNWITLCEAVQMSYVSPIEINQSSRITNQYVSGILALIKLTEINKTSSSE